MRWWHSSGYPWSMGQLFLTKKLTSEHNPTLFELELGDRTSVKLEHCWSQPLKLVGLETPVKEIILKMSEKCKKQSKSQIYRKEICKEEPVVRRRACGEAKSLWRGKEVSLEFQPPLEGWTTAPLGGVNNNPARKCSEQQTISLIYITITTLFIYALFLCTFFAKLMLFIS